MSFSEALLTTALILFIFVLVGKIIGRQTAT